MIWTCEVGESSGGRGDPMIWSSSLLPQVDYAGITAEGVWQGDAAIERLTSPLTVGVETALS